MPARVVRHSTRPSSHARAAAAWTHARRPAFPTRPPDRCRQIVNAALNVLIGISRAPHLEVKAITYPAIGNEWLDWLREVEAEEGHDGLLVAAPPALLARRGTGMLPLDLVI